MQRSLVSQNDPAGNQQRTSASGCYAVVVLAVFVAYMPLWRNGLVNFDDYVYIVDNPHVRDGFSMSAVRWAFGVDERTGNWHPLTWLSHMLDVSLFGPRAAAAFHGINLLLHAANALLLLCLLRSVGLSAWWAFAVSMVWAVHPINVESVAWAAQRKNVLSTFWWLVAMWAYTAYVRRRGWWRYAAVVFAMSLGLMSKATLVTLPLVLLLWDGWPLERWGREPRRRLLWEKVPLLALSAAVSLVTYWAQAPARATEVALPLEVRLANAALAYSVYLKKLVWPIDLAALYPHRGLSLLQPPWLYAVWVSVALLLAVSGVIWWLGRRRVYVKVGWLWYLGCLVPTIGLVHVGMQGWADRYVYVPAIGVWLAACGLLNEARGRPRWRRLVDAVAIGVLVAMMGLTWRQLGTWRNSRTLFQRAIAVTPRNPGARANLGYLLARQRDYAAALEQLQWAVSDAPADADYRVQLAKVLVQLGREDEALAEYDHAIRLDPSRRVAFHDRGLLRLKRGDAQGAMADFDAVLDRGPDDARLRYLRAAAALALGRFDVAIEDLQRSLALEPSDEARAALIQAHVAAGQRCLGNGNPEQAAQHFRKALKLDADNAAARQGLAAATQRGEGE